MPKVKQLLVLTLATITLAGCSATDTPSQSVSAETTMSYDVISEQIINNNDTMTQKRGITILREKSTGCYYTLVTSNDATTFTQMFNHAGNGNIPHCD